VVNKGSINTNNYISFRIYRWYVFYKSCLAEIRYELMTDYSGFTPYNLSDKYGVIGQDFCFRKLEIIGNKYNNPELMPK